MSSWRGHNDDNSQDSDREGDDGHVHSASRDHAVKDKKRSPPSSRPPAGPQRNPHHSASAEERESPERVEQKEKLHAELKKVLSQKRSHLRASTCQLTQSEMDPEPSNEQTDQTPVEAAEPPVEIVVETEAEAGASGYSVTGGGERGIFIKDVLKDSPAAKHLSLQQGDQLLSAKVYFDNVRYEDALKILQCAEPYKVSFLVKRTVQGEEVCVRPRLPSVDIKGPKAKMTKMSVKAIKPFKAKKKRGGRFGLKRLREKRREELVIEGTPPRLEMSDVDVEFCLPRFKPRRSDQVKAEGGAAAKAKRKIRFPRMKIKSQSGGKEDSGRLEAKVKVSPAEIPGAKAKAKGKGHKFEISFPKSKDTKSGSVELKKPDVNIPSPSVEFSLPAGKGVDVEMGGVSLNSPDVDFALPSIKADTTLPAQKGKVGIKGPKVEVRGDDAKVMKGKVDVETGKGDGKLQMPNLKLPKMRLVCDLDETDDDKRKVKAEGEISVPTVEIKGGSGIVLPEAHVNKGGILENVPSVPSVDISFPKVKGTSNMDIKTTIRKPGMDFSVSNVDLHVERIPDEVEGSFKGPEISMPTLDVSLPKMGVSDKDVAGAGSDGKFCPPSAEVGVDMSHYIGGDGKFTLPNFNGSQSQKVNLTGPGAEGEFKLPSVDLTLPKGKDVDLDMPDVNISLPKISLPEGGIKLKGPDFKKGKMDFPDIDVSLPKGKLEGGIELEGPDIKGGKFKMPTFDVSLPKVNLPEGGVKLKGPPFKGKMDTAYIDVSIPKEKFEGGIEVEGPDIKGGKFKTPSFDVSLPKVNLPEGDVKLKCPELKGKMDIPDVDVSPPKVEGDFDIKGPDVKGGKFKMPKLDVSLPQVNLPEGGVKLKGPQLKGKMETANVDVSLPKGKFKGDIELEGADVKGGKFKMPTFDVSLPKVNLPEGGIELKRPDLKGGRMEMPDIDVSLPKGKLEGGIELEGPDVKGGKFKTPSFDVSLPKVTLPEGGSKLKGPELKGGRMEMPDIDVSLPKGHFEGVVEVEGPDVKGGKFKTPSFDVSLPKVNLPEGGVKLKGPELKGGRMEMPDIDVSLPKAEGDLDIEGPDVKGGKFKMPTLDVSLPKVNLPEGRVKLKGPELKEGKMEMPDIDISLPKAEGDLDIECPDVKGGKFKMPTLDVSLPRVNLPEGGVKLKGPDLKGEKMEMPDIDVSLPKGKFEGGVEVQGPDVKGGKFKMPTFDVSLPKVNLPEGGAKLKGPELKGGRMEMPDIDVSLPKGKFEGGVEVQGPDFKGGKFKMPMLDVSLPKVNLPEGGVKLKGPELKGGKMELPDVDVSLPKVEADFDIEAPKVKGGKFKMPTLDVSLPKVSLPEGGVKLKGPELKGGKMEIPDVDGTLPKVEGDFNIECPEVKGGKMKIPTLDVSIPKVNLPKGGVQIKGSGLDGRKIEMPDLDISFPKGKAEGEIGIGKGGKFHMPSVDISLPKIKTKGPEINTEGPDGEGGKFKTPSFDVSLPKVNLPEGDVKLKCPELKGKMDIPDVDVSLPKVEGDFDIEGPHVKGRKFKMPTLDVSLPKASLAKGEVKLKGPELKGGKMEISDIDVSLPKQKVEGDVNFRGPDVKGGKFKMPSLDVSIPKVNLPEGSVKLKGPEFSEAMTEMPALDMSFPRGKAGEIGFGGQVTKGGKFHVPSVDISLPKVKTKGPEINTDGPDIEVAKVAMPMVDVSLPKVEGDLDIEGFDVKGGKFKLPAFDVSLPKVNLPESGLRVKGPELKGGKMEIPDIDVSLPKGKVEGHVDIEGQDLKGGKLKVPTLDVSIPEVKGPNLEGSKLDIPHIDVSLPKGKAGGEIGLEGHVDKGGKFHMPSVDIYLPKMKTKGPDIEFQSPDIKGGKVTMPAVDVSLPKIKSPEVDVSLEGPDVKGGKVAIPAMTGLTGEGAGSGSFKRGTVKLPTVDISAPKVDIDFGLTKPKGDDVKVALLKPEGSRPSSGGSFDLPNVSLKVPSFTLPRFGGKSKSGHLQVSGQSTEVDISLGEPSVELGLDSKVTSKKAKLKKPFIGISKTDADVSVSCPELDVNIKKGGIDIPKPDTSVDVERKGRFHAPDVTIKLPKFSMPGFASKDGDLGKPSADLEAQAKAKMPSVELSLPATKSPEKEVLLPNAEVDVLECDIRTYEGEIPKKPAIDVNVPKVDLAVPLPKIKLESSSEREGTKFTMPNVDLSLPKGKVGSMPKSKPLKIETPEVELKMQSIDVSFPKAPDADFHGHGQGDFKTPHAVTDLPEATIQRTDISIRKDKGDVHVKGEQTGLKLKMPSLDIACPKGDLELDMRLRKGDTKGVECHGETNSKVKGPKVKGTKFNIGMPKKKTGGSVKSEHDVENIEPAVSGLTSTIHNGHKEGNINIQMPGVTLPSASVKGKEDSEESGLPSSSSAIPRIPDIDFDIGTAQDEEDDKLGKKIKIPKFGVPLPSLSSREGRMEIRGPETKSEGPKVKKAVFVLVNPSQRDDAKVKIPKFQTNTIETSVSTPGMSVYTSPLSSTDDTLKPEAPSSKFHFETDTRLHRGFKDEEVAASGKVKLPKVEFTSPYGKKASGDASLETATRLGKPSLSGEAPKGLQIKPGNVSFEGFVDESSKDVVTQHSRTQMLHQDTSASPASFTMEFSSSKVQTWSEGDIKGDPQGIEAPPWFKVPKFTLKPHSTGFLQITPEGSPQAQRRGELGGEANMSGSFCQHSSDITTREVSTPGGGGSVTVVTKTTRTTRHSTPAETSAGVSVATTHPPSDL
ncbi:neuroblast differentiation-associated protein AHNAK isoform X4 [Hippocampus comes]|uniref:neuroblast differentiation-associated protein AHNAK isoform X4 n=1 Tax=Hippocampus comes TaxID=109280 RepID=UPI00094E33A6|nr:PREDICTED: neuroblast differentiation-associated protein AHNAK-like isoform X4 [Hippocampus comes]